MPCNISKILPEKISTSNIQHRRVNIAGKLVEAISNNTDCINVPEIYI